MIWFIGGGCYHADMITLGALKILKKADCILYDHLVNRELLNYAPVECEKINVGKIGHGSSYRQDDINKLLVGMGHKYHDVVRLKGGDPYLFGRGSEEMLYCLEHDLKCQYIPGISAAIGGLGFAGIPVTHRGLSSGFSVNTLHYQDGEDHIDYDLIKSNPNTQIFFMVASRVRHLVDKCLEKGMDPDTTITLASSLTYPSEKVLVSSLKDIKNEDIKDYKSPLLIVLGKTGMLHSKLDNTLNLEAYGKKILLLSVDNTHWPIDTLLLEEGITSHERQIADIVYESHDNKDLNIYDELIFVSKNAVKGFIKYLKTRHMDIRSLCGKKILCVGYKTKEYLEDMGIMADMTFDSSMELKNHIQGKALWINGNNVKTDEDSLSVYHFVSREFEIDDEYDAIGVSCPYSIEALHNCNISKEIPLFTFGHKSYFKAKELGFKNIYVTDNSKDALIKEIVRYLKEDKKDV